eukprot:754873-Hanusia_phi.AAC.1
MRSAAEAAAMRLCATDEQEQEREPVYLVADLLLLVARSGKTLARRCRSETEAGGTGLRIIVMHATGSDICEVGLRGSQMSAGEFCRCFLCIQPPTHILGLSDLCTA